MTTQEIAATLSAKGLRPTQQRIAVYQYLLDHPIHPTADTIYRALLPVYPSFSRTTIYNSLHTLLHARLIRVVNIEAEEQRFDGNPEDHGHFKCSHCGKLYDFTLSPELLGELCPSGFHAEVRDVFLNGICAGCASKGAV